MTIRDYVVITEAVKVPAYGPGTLDAIHLATATLWRESQAGEIAMATHDAPLAAAARASGFSVIGSQ